MEKPFSAAAARNAPFILAKLQELFANQDVSVLEIGSGTGQHGAWFAQNMPHMKWTCSDLAVNHEGIRLWMAQANLPNLRGPLLYEAGATLFPEGEFDVVYTANTFHIMSWKKVKTLVKAAGKSLRPGAQFLIYGPFNYNREYTSASNREFDQSLKSRDPLSGIRDFEDVKKQMQERGFRLIKDWEMPANNRLLNFLKI